MAALPRRVKVDLTERERAVLRHLLAGHRDQDIAREMLISARTVRSRVRELCGKLGVRNRTALAARAVAWRLVRYRADPDEVCRKRQRNCRK